MMKSSLHKIFFLCFAVGFISCKKTDWQENYREKEKSPFGNYIIFNEAESLFKNQEIEVLQEHFYDYTLFNYDEDSINKKSYVLIKDIGFKQNSEGNKALLEFVKNGNTAFIALNYFRSDFKDALEFTTNSLDKFSYNRVNLKKLSGKFSLKHYHFKDSVYNFERNIRTQYFLEFNKKKTIVLGTTEIGGEQLPNFIKIYHGKGAFYLHINPVVFTNYYLLNDKEDYIEKVFSYLPKNTILWDKHIKNSTYGAKPKAPSIFKFFLKHPTLTWFLGVAFTGLLLFMLFNARRKQRAIPVIAPLKNTTVAFTQTIANLYLSEGDHKNLVDKKIAFFLQKVRSKFLLNTNNLNTDFIGKLALKSGNDLQKTKYLINTIIALNKKTTCSEEELIVLHKMIEKFLNK
ncbi:hypothetical protein [uncultured Polaribacter sp.]|uniref:hypothetical protein n=1 Tax=uncultured Polaribacter sp. TaxID=174711 RepID=UPI00260E5C2B|nr:hypothetical protein [uncultured Polaribacter sp.]